MLDETGRWDWIALWNQVRETQMGPGRRHARHRTSPSKLKRQKRAVRGAELPGLHCGRTGRPHAAARGRSRRRRLFFTEETQAAADALIGRDDGAAPGDRPRRRLDRQELAGRALRQGRRRPARRRRSAGRRAPDDRGRGRRPRRRPHHPPRRAAQPGHRTAGQADPAADRRRLVARRPLCRRRLDLDPAGGRRRRARRSAVFGPSDDSLVRPLGRASRSRGRALARGVQGRSTRA